jgi:hypothetical protein
MASRGAKKARRRAPRPAPQASRGQPARDDHAAADGASDAGASGPSPLNRVDAASAGAVGALACLLFSSTFSQSVGLGDAPESVAGVKSLGVLHAPGYPSYVLLAHAFAKVVPIGGWALRVNLFSIVCAALTVVAVFLLARMLGASLLGSGLGALALATSASFWFNAGFAKHYALSGLLVTGGALAGVLWQVYPKGWWLAGAAVLLGAGMGASWELTLIMLAGLVALLWFGPRRPPLLTACAAVAALVVFAAASLAFMIARARQHPAVNWGEVTNMRRLVTQVSQQDFRASDPQSGGTATIGAAPSRVFNYLGIVARDLGLGACLMAVVGMAAAVRLNRGRKLFLALVAVLNVVAVSFATGVDRISGFFTGLFAGGFLIDVLVVIALLIALGTAPTVDWLSDAIARLITPSRKRSQLPASIARVQPFVVVGIVALVLAPSLLVHHSYANHRMPRLADNYAKRVLAEVPANAVLVVGGYEFSEPMRYRQIVDGSRPDVVVVSGDLLGREWYREQVARMLGTTLPPVAPTNGEDAIRLMKQLRSTRPVFVDTLTMYLLGTTFGYRAHGFVGEFVDGSGPHAAVGGRLTAADLDRADRNDGLGSTRYLRFPNEFVYYIHQRAHIELAKQLSLSGDEAGVGRQLERAVALVPSDTPARIALKHFRDHDPKLREIVLAL